jgi:hypothetical protein
MFGSKERSNFMTIEATHCFEKSGLGKAPFHCVGLYSLPSTSLAASNPTAYNNALAEAPRNIGCGACCYCGTPIVHNFIIESADKRRFVVGSDCVAKTGDAGLLKAVRAERLKVVREAREIGRRAKREEREAAWKREREERAEVFKVEHAALIKSAEAFNHIDFVRDVIGRGLEGRWVSDKALAAVAKCIAENVDNAAFAGKSEYVGKIGERLTIKGKVVRVASFVRPCFGSYGNETVWVVSIRDEVGNVFVTKTPSFGHSTQKGDTVALKGTVKEHSEWKGEKQTVLQRVKELEVAA